MTVSLTSFVHLTDGHVAAPVDGETVILNVARGAYYGLDDIGSAIWRHLAEPVRVDALCDALAENYDGDRATIERDVLGLLDLLAAEGLVTVSE